MDQMVARRSSELGALCVEHRVARLAVFGSAATGGFDPATSDLDFLVEFAPLPPRERADAYFGLLESLERHFGVSVDLVEAGPVRNPYLRKSIEESRVVIYEAA
jgi:predicted nucleotidyltransferase